MGRGAPASLTNPMTASRGRGTDRAKAKTSRSSGGLILAADFVLTTSINMQAIRPGRVSRDASIGQEEAIQVVGRTVPAEPAARDQDGFPAQSSTARMVKSRTNRAIQANYHLVLVSWAEAG
jgi:hypothetical protein